MIFYLLYCICFFLYDQYHNNNNNNNGRLYWYRFPNVTQNPMG